MRTIGEAYILGIFKTAIHKNGGGMPLTYQSQTASFLRESEELELSQSGFNKPAELENKLALMKYISDISKTRQEMVLGQKWGSKIVQWE